MSQSQNQKPTSFSPSVQNFLESLRQRSSAPSAEEPSLAGSAFERFQEKKRLEQQRKAEFFQARTKEFKEVYSQKKQQEQQQIQVLQEKLKNLAASFKNLKKEVAVAVDTKPVEVNAYQESFLDHLSNVLDILKRQVESSSTWLHVFNQRSQKRSYYWAQAGKSGTKFMFSQERQLANSVG